MKIALKDRVPKALLTLGLPLLIVAIAGGCSKSEAKPKKGATDDAVPITVAGVKSLPMDRKLTVVGTLFPKDEATIAAQVEGQVEKTLVDFGDRVAVGQELARIDTASYEAVARQADANVAKAKATALNAEQDLQRVQQLQKENISAASDLDKATAAAAQARAEVKAAEAAQAIAQLNLERSHVKAPFGGAIAERIANAGDYVKIGTPLFRAVNDGTLKLIVQAPEAYAGLVKNDQRVAFNVDAFPTNRFEAAVYLVSPQINTTTRAFSIAASVDNSDHRLRANTFARGELVLEKDVPTVVIPVEAVVNFAGVTKVFVVENDKVKMRQVEVGRIHDGTQEIRSGLKAGETVVLTGQTKLHEGSSVRIKTEGAKE